MRPPQNAGESLPRRLDAARHLAASMRPPQNAGESDAIDIDITMPAAVLQ